MHSSVLGEYFGRSAFGRILGVSMTIQAPLAIASPILVGAAAYAQGTYEWAFVAGAAVGVTSSVLFLLVRRPRLFT